MVGSMTLKYDCLASKSIRELLDSQLTARKENRYSSSDVVTKVEFGSTDQKITHLKAINFQYNLLQPKCGKNWVGFFALKAAAKLCLGYVSQPLYSLILSTNQKP